MAKRSGLSQAFFLCAVGSGPAYNLSGDIGSIDTADCSLATLDVTGIDKSAHERIVGLGDGKLAYTAFWNNTAGGQHAVVSPLKGTKVRGLWLGSSTEGDGLAFAISGILTNYAVTRAANGSLMAKPTIDGYIGELPDWGQLMAYAVDASGTVNHTAVDFGAYGSVQTITAITKAVAAVVTVTAHGYASGDSVSISGSNSTVSIDGDWVVTVINANSFSVPVDTSGGASAGTTGSVQKTSSRLGGVLVAVVGSVASGTNYTVQWATSADNGVNDAYSNVAGLVTPSLTSGAAEARVRVNSVLIKRWNRLVGAGTYTNAVIVAMGKRYQSVE